MSLYSKKSIIINITDNPTVIILEEKYPISSPYVLIYLYRILYIMNNMHSMSNGRISEIAMDS